MPKINTSALTTEQANELLQILKEIVRPQEFVMPGFGDPKEIADIARKNEILAILKLHVERKGASALECKFSSSLIHPYLKARICGIDMAKGPYIRPHFNTCDGSFKPVLYPHMHVYSKEYGDRVAHELAYWPNEFKDPEDIIQTFVDFLEFCNIENRDKLNLQRELL